jgi:probable F420-dependent oxidoreductase
MGLPGQGESASPENQIKVIQKAEVLGFHYALIGDHIVIPKSFASTYPYSQTGEFSSRASGEYLDQLMLLSFLAGSTTSIRLVPSVMIVPHRNPIVAAKQLATLDVLSKGRLTLGVGAGWLREEFEALGIPPFEKRGAVTNEYLDIFKELWSNDNPTFQGEYCSFSDIMFEPKPIQKPHPPIWIGGESKPAMRRAARHGTAWHPLNANPKYPLDTANQLETSIAWLRNYSETIGRNPLNIDVAYRVSEHSIDPDNRKTTFSGTPSEIAEEIVAFKNLGVTDMIFDFRNADVTLMINRMELFAAEIMPLVGKELN